MTKRVTACILSLLLLLSTMPVSVLAATVSTIGDWEYEIVDGSATITKYIGSDRRPELPSYLDGYPVTAIGPSAFSGNGSLTRLDIPDSIQAVKSGAFSGCSALQTVRIASLKAWCEIAFESSSANPLSTGKVALQVRNSSTGSYQKVTDLSGLYWGGSVGNYAFINYTGLTSASFPSGLRRIGNEAFSGCTSLEEVEFPYSLEAIGSGAFSGCTALTQLILPYGVSSIGSSAFSGCSSLTHLEFPSSIETVGSGAFSSCRFTDVYLDDLESWCEINFPNSGSNPLNNAKNLYVRGIPVTDLILPYGIETINAYSFYGFQGLKCVILPESVEFIDTSAFQNCKNLESLLIPDSDISIAGDAFSSCTAIRDIYYTGSQALWEEYFPNSPFPATVNFIYNTPKYTVTIAPGSGYGTSIQTAAIGNRSYQLPACAFNARTGHHFKAWEINGEEYAEGNVFLPQACANDGSVTVTALWAGINHTIQFMPGEGSGSMDPVTVAYGTEYQLPACDFTAPTGKVFQAWRINYVNYPAGSGYMPTGDATATAIWTDITYTVSFDPGEGSGSMADETAVYDRAYKLPESTFTAPEGLFFKAWRIGETDEIIPAGGTFVATEDTTVTATWAERLTVSFEPNGGTGEMSPIPAAAGNSVKLPECSFTAPDGMGFKAWLIGETEYAPGISVTVNENLTAKAVWAERFTLSFDRNCGTGEMESLSALSGKAITLPSCGFVAPDYTGGFKAWFIGGQFYAPGQKYTLTADTTATAAWKNLYTVSFVADNDTEEAMEPSVVVEGDYYILPQCPFTAPDDAGFMGWRINDDVFLPGSRIFVTGDTTVTAVWTELCEVSFDANGGSGEMASMLVAAGTSFELPEHDFVAPHAKYFRAWQIDGVEYDPGETVIADGNTTVTAVWDDLYSVFFDSGDGIGSMGAQTIPNGESVTLPACDFTAPDGCVFEAWEINGTEYTIGSSYKPSANTNVTAVWNSLYECSVSSGETTITRYKGSEERPSIPAILGGFPVTGIGSSAFAGCNTMTGIAIPEGIKTIGAGAFSSCAKMVRVDIPSSLTAIGSGAFSSCPEMTGVYITDLAAWCAISFANSAANPLSIPGNLYLDGKLVTQLSIPAGVTGISDYAFYKCTSVNTLDTSLSALTEIGSNAFSRCTSLSEVGQFPNSLTRIGSSAFSGCTALTNLGGLPDSLTSIESSAFSGCTKLSNVALPSGLTEISESIFSSCTGLKDITIPASITAMKSGAFSGCSIDVVRVTDLAKWCKIEFTDPSSNPLNNAKSMYVRNAPITDLSIQDEISSVSNYAFYGFQGLKCVIIPQNAAIIYRYAFMACSNLEYVMIPEGMQSLGVDAFASCPKLKDVYYTGDEAKWKEELPNYKQLASSSVTVHYNAKQITITLAPGEGVGVSEQTSAISGRPYVLTEPNFTAPTGKHFTAWQVGELELLRGQSFEPEDSITIVALWGDITYLVSFSANGGGGEMSSRPIKEGNAIELPECGYTAPTGKQFKAWLIDGQEYLPGEEYTPNAETTVTAVWEPLVCTVSFDPGDGTGSMDAVTTTYQVAVTLPQCTFTAPVGKVFYRWMINERNYAPDATFKPTEDTVATAVWQDLKCKLTFNAGEGSGTMNDVTGVVYGTERKLPACSFTAPDGKAFRSWEIDGERYAAGATFTVLQDTTITAIWADVFHATFDANGGNGWMSDLTAVDGDAITLPRCSFSAPTGKQFKAWEINGTEYAVSSSYVPASNVTVTAVWEPIPCKITFEPGEYGVGEPMIEFADYGFDYTLPNCPDTIAPLPDLQFKAWKLGATEYAPGSVVVPTAAMKFTAVWTGTYLFTFADGQATVTAYNGSDTELTIPATLGGYPVTAIGAKAFARKTDLTSVTIPDGVISIGSEAFTGCTALTRVAMPDGLLRIENSAFSGCTKLADAALPVSVTSLGSQAFNNCSSLPLVRIPAGMTAIGSSAFSGCKNLEAVHITDLAAWCAIGFADSGSNPLSIAKNLYLNGNLVTKLTFPENTELAAIGDYAFYKCLCLEEAALPAGLAQIGNYAFTDCTRLTGVEIPDGATSIGTYAFSGCTALTDVALPDSVTAVGSYAFGSCTALASATLSAGLTDIPESMFSNCRALTGVVLPDGVKKIAQNAFYSCSKMETLSLPAGLTDIGSSAFYDCGALDVVSITDLAAWCNITFASAYSNPLYYAQSLSVRGVPVTDLTIQDNISLIRMYAFNHFRGLRSVIIPQNATSILQNVFTNCENLEYILLPEGMQTLGDGTFNNCKKLTDVYFTGSEEQWLNVPNYRQFVREGVTIHCNAQKITITFDANNGSGATEETSAISGRPYVLLGCPFTPPADHAFRSWRIGETAYAPGDSVTATEDLTVAAMWEQNLTAVVEDGVLRYRIRCAVPEGAMLLAAGYDDGGRQRWTVLERGAQESGTLDVREAARYRLFLLTGDGSVPLCGSWDSATENE